MKTAAAQDLALHSSDILAWLKAGETIVLVQNGETLGRIVPDQSPAPRRAELRRELFARRFAPLASVPDRDLSDIVSENRGDS